MVLHCKKQLIVVEKRCIIISMNGLSDKYLSYSEKFVVAVDEVDFLERLKPSAVLQYFQDIATAHADILGIGYEKMREKNMIWVLTRISVEFYRYPQIGEEIVVTTFPKKPNIADAVRDFYMTDSKGNVIVAGSSKWLVIDADSRMIRRCSVLFDYKADEYIPQNPFDGANSTLSDIDEEYGCVMSNTVRLSDLDRNRHMNNARYGDIILNAFDPKKFESEIIKGFDINFLNELRYGDNYCVYRADKDDISSIKADREGTTVFRARICWERND